MRIADARRAKGRPTALAAAAALLALLLIFLLSGCASTPRPKPTPTPTAVAPVFASEEEALAAATEVYAEYQELVDRIFSEGGNDPSRIAAVVTPELAESEIQSFEQAKLDGLRSVGSSTFNNVKLQKFMPNAQRGEDSISLYLCSDISDVDVIGTDGKSVVGADRADTTPFEVVFALGLDDSLVVSSRTVWARSGAC